MSLCVQTLWAPYRLIGELHSGVTTHLGSPNRACHPDCAIYFSDRNVYIPTIYNHCSVIYNLFLSKRHML